MHEGRRKLTYRWESCIVNTAGVSHTFRHDSVEIMFGKACRQGAPDRQGLHPRDITTT